MPHFKTSTLNLPTLPFRAEKDSGTFVFVDCCKSLNNHNFSLLYVQFTPKDSTNTKEFFLEIKKKESYFIVRYDKHSRISPIEIIKNALEILMHKQTTLLSHNLNPANIAPSTKLPFIKNINDFLDFKALLKQYPFKEIWLEIGFGSGRQILHHAQTHLDILHIGLEVHNPSLEQVARQIGLLKLGNILVLAYDARIFLELLPSNILHKIFVHFPIPWDKKPHRRIFSHTFLTQASRTLVKGGHLQLRTDSLEYFTFAKELANNFTKEFKTQESKNTQGTITSKYEARWKRQNKDFYNLEFYALLESAMQILDFTFDFLEIKIPEIRDFKPIHIVKESYFLHIEALLTSPTLKILKVTFGDFNYPQTRYILQTQTHLQYFSSNPLPTLFNHKAHYLLLEILKNNFKAQK